MFDVEVPVRNEGMREGKKEYVSDSLDGREEERDGESVLFFDGGCSSLRCASHLFQPELIAGIGLKVELEKESSETSTRLFHHPLKLLSKCIGLLLKRSPTRLLFEYTCL